MATLYCPCAQAHKLWAEFWYAEGHYRWVFFDDVQTSETYAEQIEKCPACGRPLERKDLTADCSDIGPLPHSIDLPA